MTAARGGLDGTVDGMTGARRSGPWRHVAAALQLLGPQVASAARERRDTLVLLLAVAVVAVPHMEHLPVWASLALATMWTWRVALTLGRRALPGRSLMLPLLVGAVSAVWLQHHTLLGRDAGVTFLLLLLGLKLLEMRARRDVFVVVFLAFFVLLTQFLFGQGLPIALAVLVAVVALFFVLVSVHLVDGDLTAGRKLRLVALMMLKATPLALALFLLFPRLSGPLWGLPGEGGGATSGLSNSMSPGSISRLLESDAIALRAQFEGPVPPRNQLYWRGPVFGAFNGRSWTPLAAAGDPRQPMPEVRIEPASAVSYTVTLMPHRHDWLFALELAMPLKDDSGAPLPARMTPELLVLSAQPVLDRMRYNARSFLRFQVGTPPTDPVTGEALPNETVWGAGARVALADLVRLPPGYNPRTLQFALDLRHQIVADDAPPAVADPALVNAVLDHLRRGGFRYTLDPPALGRDSVDEFLFDTRQGYCEHYAAAFVVLMRALDVPARVVTGYQGGEVNPVDGFLTVRQSDAHAWAEVWLAGQGWVRVDPTAAVSPSRIDDGAAEVARRQGLGPLSDRIAPLAWLRSLRLNWEALDNAWGQWVLSYSPERQRALLDLMGLAPSAENLAWVFAVSVTTLLALLGAWSLRHRTVHDPLADADRLVRRRLAEAGIAAPAAAGPRTLAALARAHLAPASAAEAALLLDWLEQQRYARPGRPEPADRRAMLRRLRRWRPERAPGVAS